MKKDWEIPGPSTLSTNEEEPPPKKWELPPGPHNRHKPYPYTYFHREILYEMGEG